MAMSLKPAPNVAYYRVANKAVVAERCGKYEEAVKLWREARDEALDVNNQQWATDRIEFCGTAVARGWKGGTKRERKRV